MLEALEAIHPWRASKHYILSVSEEIRSSYVAYEILLQYQRNRPVVSVEGMGHKLRCS